MIGKDNDRPAFQVLDDDNSVVVTLNDNAGIAPTEELITLDDPGAITYSIQCYQLKHQLMRDRVGYGVEPITVWRARQPKQSEE